MGAPGPRPPAWVGALKSGDWQSGSESASSPPPARACPSSAAYNGVPSPGELRGHGTMGISPLRGSLGTPAGHRPTGGRAQRGRWSPGNSPAAVRARPDALAMCWPWPGSLSPLPVALCVGTTRSPRRQGTTRSPAPACSGGKVSGVWVCPPEMAELVGQEMHMNNGSHVYCTLQFSNHFTVYEVLCTLCSSLWFTTCCTVDKVL